MYLSLLSDIISPSLSYVICDSSNVQYDIVANDVSNGHDSKLAMSSRMHAVHASTYLHVES